MALTSTIYQLSIELSDIDRGVYETLDLRAARHPSETSEYLVTRVLAYCLEYTEGIAFTQGLSDGQEPAVLVRDLTGKITAWIEVGMPDADRVHRAAKLAERVAIYTHRDIRQVMSQLNGKKIHRAAEIPVIAFDKAFIAEFAEALDRRTVITLSVTEGHLYLGLAGRTLETVLAEHHIEP